ncbi:hypothetical protein BXY41_11633 [Lacrimispora xylanisolvens]|uniref:Uncharacterized protein n=1 Tax=Lacrimispora xylanisolvens TaxID=384636 RepID=A0A2S6HJ44_9FIRM|nr:hypothetical protein [Hungatella xylanolytica]PPK77495.1 hypothetical protein BXY41_11633 [Hungatella xylanolytica]
MDETEVVYGTIGMLPSEEYNPNKQYEILNLVSYDGSSYVVHTKPPIGTLPTNLDYWQVSALGTSKATANSVGTVKPDGTTMEVSADGSLSAKTATQNTLGLVKGSNGIKVGTDGSVDINTLFEQATELANIIAGEAIASALGKISKSIAVTMNLDQNALLKNMLTNMDANDQNKIPTSAFVHNLWERIGMGEDLEIGENLTAVVKVLNSNLSYKTYETKFTINSDASAKVIFTKYGQIKRFSMWGLNEWYAASTTEIKLCDLPADVIPSGGGFYKYMQYDTGKYGYVSIHDNAMYLLLATALNAGDKVTLQDVYF